MSEDATVYHVEDEPLIRRTMEMLARSVRLGYAGFGSVAEFLAGGRDGPGCLVTDLRMPGLGGMELIRHVQARGMGLPILVFTAFAEVEVAVAAMKAGVADFIQKPASDQVLLEAIQSAVALDARRRSARQRRERTAAKIDGLNPGERQVLEAVVRGRSNKEIASALTVSQKTVEARRSRLMEKMGHETLAGLLVEVIEWREAGGELG